MNWILFIIFLIGYHVGLYGMFQKAGMPGWKALIPFYNYWCIIEKTGLKKFWFFLLFIPVVGVFVAIWITIIFVMHFGRFNVLHHAATVFIPFIYFPYLGFSKDERYAGKAVFNNYRKPASREWIDAAAFAVVAATIIRTFIFEAYTIPSPSMEKTLLVNDFLFVNKVAYGPRVPQTPLSFPFVHNLMPNSQVPSYLKWVQLPYRRLPGYDKVERNDVVVFNFPVGDTVINHPEYGSFRPYYDVLRVNYKGNRDALMADWGDQILVHPMDKTDNYIKRCVGVPGDSIELVNGVLYVNGNIEQHPQGEMTHYRVKTDGRPIDLDNIQNNVGVELRWSNKEGEIAELNNYYQRDSSYILNMTPADAETIRKMPNVTAVEMFIFPQENLWPHDPRYTWSIDNYGPLWIPQAGVTIPLNAENLPLYERLIRTYEGHELTHNGNQIMIDGQPATSYTFKYNYYWMMGDNRHNSQDSRYWGFVPETHIVGRPSFIWFSWENGPRWNRLFKSIH